MNGWRAAATALLLLLGACRGPSLREYTPRPGPYDALTESQTERLARARRYLDSGADEAARIVLEALAHELPDNLSVAVMLQDVELEMLASGRAPAELEERFPATGGTGPPGVANAAVPAAATRIAAAYTAQLEQRRDPVTLVLAARFEPDPDAAHALLDEALADDATCIWALYGLAFLDARGGSSREALDVVDRALALDEGHLPSRRLEARLLQRLGETTRARHGLETWLEDSADDPRVGPAARAEATLDLASLLITSGHDAEALVWIEGLDPSHLPPGPDLELLRAAALDADREAREALSATELARGLDPTDPLPRIQAALLQELRLGDSSAALEEWRAAAELARAQALGEGAEGESAAATAAARNAATENGIGVDLTAMLLWAQARTHVERAEARLAAEAASRP